MNTRIYPLGDQWGLYINGTETVLDTRLEAELMSTKAVFVAALQQVATVLAQAGADLDDMAEIYTDRQYDGPANIIEDADVSSLSVTAAQVSAMVAAVPDFLSYITANRTALNNMRVDK